MIDMYRRPNKRCVFRWGQILSLLSLCFFIGGCTKKAPGFKKAELITKVEEKPIVQQVFVGGVVEPQRKALVVAPYDGYVREIFVRVGDRVRKGDRLVSVSASLSEPGPHYPLRAPFDGIVVQVLRKEGEYVRKADDNNLILRVDDLSNLYVYANAPELEILKILKGQGAKITPAASLGMSFSGKVQEIFLSAKHQERWSNRADIVEFPVVIEVLDENENLRPGMTVNVEITTAEKNLALLLPHEYIERDKDGKFQVTLQSGEVKPIQVGLQNQTHAEVMGLKKGDKVRLVNFYKDVD